MQAVYLLGPDRMDVATDLKQRKQHVKEGTRDSHNYNCGRPGQADRDKPAVPPTFSHHFCYYGVRLNGAKSLVLRDLTGLSTVTNNDFV